jgi:hypothetical protein
VKRRVIVPRDANDCVCPAKCKHHPGRDVEKERRLAAEAEERRLRGPVPEPGGEPEKE